MEAKFYFDGACDNRSLTPLMGVGVLGVVRGHPNIEFARCIGMGTSNVAEWAGLIAALRLALELEDIDKVHIFGDSQLIVKQFCGEWRVRKKHLKPLYRKALLEYGKLRRRGVDVEVIWIPRDQNTEADRLSKAAFFIDN